MDHTYYENAESEAWMQPFWGEGSLFLERFSHLDLSSVIDFACGHGRHAAQFLGSAGEITLVDANKSNIDRCRGRFRGQEKVGFYLCNGRDIAGIPDGTASSIVSYDAMVHFEAFDVINYLFEFSRVLNKEGQALLHFSVNDQNPTGNFRDDTANWRSYFSRGNMEHFAHRAGFEVSSLSTFPWPPNSSDEHTDGLVLLRKMVE
ncbi:class I SAM-dependent methyltransferase [Methylobacterium brachiatum]|uniref:Class I SAM-dependent methyltransferase n=1 Tax=Methylobacterium brachiatum TaxID=269660 RepID=A0ABV1R758_9HYPH